MSSPVRPIFQYAYLVNDVDEAARRWIAGFGAGPFFMVRHHRAEGYFRYRGTDIQADVSYAFSYSGPVQIQLIQQHDESRSIYREMFRQGEEGLHHVGILGDVAAEKERLQRLGYELAIEMWSGADVIYLDGRRQIGCFVEVHGDAPLIREVFAKWQRACAEWDGESEPLREL